MSKRDGGPAFPTLADVEYESGHALELDTSGMSLRDWFAGQALNGLIASIQPHERLTDHPLAAKNCYAVADAMLAERAKPTGNEKWTTEEILRQEG